MESSSSQKKIISPSIAMKGKLRYLTYSQVLLLLLFPFLEGGKNRMMILIILFSVILFLGIHAVSYQRKNVIIGSIFGLPWFLLTWVNFFISTPSFILATISDIFLCLFYFFTALLILSYILKSSRVTGDVLYGAVSVYLLIGGAWYAIYTVIYSLHPGSFIIAAIHNIDGVINWSDFLYFSFSTLTTLGYGDVIPVTSSARSFAMLEAIVGVMYLAIIISRLVGLYIADSLNSKSVQRKA